MDSLNIFEIPDLLIEYGNLPELSKIDQMPVPKYYGHAQKLRKYCTSDFLNMDGVSEYTKLVNWCKYITNFDKCSIAPHPSEFHSLMLSIGGQSDPSLSTAPPIMMEVANTSFSNSSSNVGGCYDHYYCSSTSNSSLFFSVYGVMFSLLCAAGLLLNLACLVGFNKATNRCGATLYFSVIAMLDCLYLSLKLALTAVPHLSDFTYSGQERAYAQRAACLVPLAMPFLVFCEVASVWLIVCLLVERYLFLRRGYFSKSVTSLQRHVRIIIVVLLLSLTYAAPYFFEYQCEPNPNIPNGFRAVYTETGSSAVYRNLVDYLLNIPLEMFLPYLAVGMLTTLAVSKMVDLGSSKWKTVTGLCSCYTYCCGSEFTECYSGTARSSPNEGDGATNNSVVGGQRHSTFEDSLPRHVKSGDDKTQVLYCGIPFEKRSDLVPFYFLVPPPPQTVKETANVVITVCLGFLLLVTKIPRLILLAVQLESYIEMDSTLTRMTNDCIGMAFVVLKAPIYLLLGVHFRHALTGLCCCACLYAPVTGGGSSDGNGKDFEKLGSDAEMEVGIRVAAAHATADLAVTVQDERNVGK